MRWTTRLERNWADQWRRSS